MQVNYFQLTALVPNKGYTHMLRLKCVGVIIMHELIQKCKYIALNYILMKQVGITMTHTEIPDLIFGGTRFKSWLC